MSKLELEIDGKRRAVTIEELSALVLRKVVSPNDVAWLDDTPRFVSEIVRVSVDDELRRQEDGLPGGTSPNDPPLGYYSDEQDEMERRRASDRAMIRAIVASALYFLGGLCFLYFYPGENSYFFRDKKEKGESVEIATTDAEELEPAPIQSPDATAATTSQNENEAPELVGESTPLETNDLEEASADVAHAERKAFARDDDDIAPDALRVNLPDVHDAVLSFSEKVEKQRVKDEFETETEYRQRLARDIKELEDAPLLGEIRFGVPVLFPFDVVADESEALGNLATGSVKYDADRKDWTFAVQGINVVRDPNLNETPTLYFTLQALTHKESVARFIEVYDGDYLSRIPSAIEYGIHAKTPFPTIERLDKLEFTLKNTPLEFAKEMKGRLEGVCVADLKTTKPSVTEVERQERVGMGGYLKATRNQLRSLDVENLEFWFYNVSTGEVVAKFAFEEYFTEGSKSFADAKRVDASASRKEPSPTPQEEESASSEALAEEEAPELPWAPVPEPTWEEVLAQGVDSEESWEKKKPTITIPDDAPSLADAIAKTKKGDVIRLRSTGGITIPLRGKKAARGENPDVVVDHAVAIVGETGRSEDATITIGAEESLVVANTALAAFKGVTFKVVGTKAKGASKASITLESGATCKFKNCAFHGANVPNAVGVAVEGKDAQATFWKCAFQEYDSRQGLLVDDSGKATLEFCQFLLGNRYGLSSLGSAKVRVEKSLFQGNVTGFQAEGGGGVVVSNSFFLENENNWSISPGSRGACDTEEENVVSP